MNQKTENDLRNKLSSEQIQAPDLSNLKGASSWSTTIPNENDPYRWSLKRLLTMCLCGKAYHVNHALSCAKGGLIHQRHDRVCDFFAKTMSEVHKDVSKNQH